MVFLSPVVKLQRLEMEPVSKKPKADGKEAGSTPQKPIQIDNSKMQKFQRIANNLEQKILNNGSSEITKKDLKRDTTGGKKLELIVGKLSCSDRISSRPVPLNANNHMGIRNNQNSDQNTKEAECQTDFDIDKKVKDILQQKLNVDKQIVAAFETSSVHKLHKENELLRKKAKNMEAKLALAFQKLKQIENAKSEADKSNKLPDAKTSAPTKVTQTKEIPATRQTQMSSQGQSSTITATSTRAERPSSIPAPPPTTRVPKSTPPLNSSLPHHTQRLPPLQSNRPSTSNANRAPSTQVYRSPPLTTTTNFGNRYALAQRAADTLLQSTQAPQASNVIPQHLPGNGIPQNVPNGPSVSRMQVILPAANQAPVRNAGPYQGMPPNYNNVSRLQDNVWPTRPPPPPTHSQPPHRQQAHDGSLVYSVRQPQPVVQVIRPQPPPMVSNPLPPPVKLSISSSESGIVLSWDLLNSNDDAGIVDNYHLYACQGTDMSQRTNPLWKRIGVVKALPLPMACTLTQFVRGSSYHFVVAAIDKKGVQGDLSNSCTMRLGNG